MEPNTILNKEAKELLNAQTHIWNHVLSFLNSMALKCAIQLGIPDAIHKHGKPMTLIELADSLSVHPDKAPCLRQLMRLLVHSNFFSTTGDLPNIDGEQRQILARKCQEAKDLAPNGSSERSSPSGEEEEEEAFGLTLCSQLLLKDHPFSQTPFALLEMDPSITDPSHNLGEWFRTTEHESPFHMAQGKNIYERMPSVSIFNELFNRTMSYDSRLVSSLLVTSNEFKGLIEGLESIVDIGGGDGTMAKAIAEAYPNLKCDMFEMVPRAHAVLIKWAFHNWSDDHCIKALQRCKEAIPSKEKGGKVMIIEMVMGVVPSDNNVNHSHSQLLMDMQMLSVSRGKERTEEQWKYLFINAGFGDYKILPILGSRSIIEVYPA
ncbi:trans-resveratrol di-O-methyltransferase isoform X2 [Spinacia oleracea]|uniref:Trans-resveratrol di-O-methyltransferase isoform X2 n=1 Tax=Spinacia oleracea TaxID=3562 RepID=A0ABM3RJV5_SPIOL|nr:trans-resveratrol di-O-methyltransferase-like isoform X2 [Spinacia oleracea]